MILKNYNKSKGILYVKFSGVIGLNEIVEYIRETKSNKSYPRMLRILTDATGAKMNFTAGDVEVLIQENLESLKQYDYILDAIILDSPKETALSMLFQKLSEKENYKIQIFLTELSAEIWLQRTYNYLNSTMVDIHRS